MNRLKGFQGSRQVFGIIPAADDQDGRFDVLEMRQDVAGLPILVINSVSDDVGPVWITKKPVAEVL